MRSTTFSLEGIDLGKRDVVRVMKALFLKYSFRPSKRLSQTFLVSPTIIDKMLKYADLEDGDIVLDIGAGFGVISAFISKEVRKVYAIEIDEKLVKMMEDFLKPYDNVEIINGDFMKIELPIFNKVISNPPYSLSSKIILKLSSYEFERAVLIFQEDFADRIRAKPGSKAYSRISFTSQLLFNVDVKDRLPPSVFYPKPDIHSRIVIMEPRKLDEKIKSLIKSRLFEYFIAWLFQNKARRAYKNIRLFLRKCLKLSEDEGERILNKMPPLVNKRVFLLDENDIIAIFKSLLDSLEFASGLSEKFLF
ncbi:MAG: 16S rRNA (adenine(1518)-N(6)/adenine(1519)-N(6))-dimethyltransferase RsmA [Candidatus Asgardarchaeia archaeon]